VIDRPRRRLAWSILLLACNGCSWLGLSDSQEKPPPPPEVKASAKGLGGWRAQIGRSPEYVLTPAVEEGTVFAAGQEGQIAAFEATTGRELWRVNTKRALSGGVGAGGHLVLVGTKDGEVLAFDDHGKRAWSALINGEVLAPPAVGQDMVVARTGDGRIFGLNSADGKRKWVLQRSTPALTLRGDAGLFIAQGAAFAGFPGGKLAALALSNGNVLWESTVAIPRGATELERIADVSGMPIVDGHQVCAVAFQGRLACFALGNGNLLWSRDFSSSTGLAADGDNVYVSDERGGIHAFNKRDGAAVWNQERLHGRKPSGPAVFGHYLMVGDIEGYAYVLDTGSGDLVGRFQTDGTPVVGETIALPGGAVMQTRDGTLFAVTAPE
jgi:outer membrane protein assembly factor BamB